MEALWEKLLFWKKKPKMFKESVDYHFINLNDHHYSKNISVITMYKIIIKKGQLYHFDSNFYLEYDLLEIQKVRLL